MNEVPKAIYQRMWPQDLPHELGDLILQQVVVAANNHRMNEMGLLMEVVLPFVCRQRLEATEIQLGEWHFRHFHIISRKGRKTGVLTSMAAKQGNVPLLEWLREKKCPWGPKACALAAKRGRLDLLKWLRERNCPWDEFAFLTQHEGHLEVLKSG